MMLITPCIDTEKVLIDNLNVTDLTNLYRVSKTIYKNYLTMPLIKDLKLCMMMIDELPVSKSDLILNASKFGCTHLLMCLVALNNSCKGFSTGFYLAVEYGHVDTVKFWLQQPGTLIHTKKIYKTQNIAILDLLLLNKHKLKMFYHDGMAKAAKHGRLDIMKWWNVPHDLSKYCMRETNILIQKASRHGHLDILIWLKATFSDFCPSAYALALASKKKHIDVLKWWMLNTTGSIYSIMAEALVQRLA